MNFGFHAGTSGEPGDTGLPDPSNSACIQSDLRIARCPTGHDKGKSGHPFQLDPEQTEEAPFRAEAIIQRFCENAAQPPNALDIIDYKHCV